MANLNYLTNYLPYNWHMNRVRYDIDGNKIPKLDVDQRQVDGAIGEMNVISWVNSVSAWDDIIFNNVLVPTPHSASGDIELDILWLSSEGLIVIEVKTLSGLIETHGHGRWTQCFDNHSVQIPSPVEQCFNQIKALKRQLRDRSIKIPVRGMVALANQNELRVLDVQRLPVVCSPDELSNEANKYKEFGPADDTARVGASELILSFDRN